MKEELLAIQTKFAAEIDAAGGLASLEDIRVAAFGKKGEMTAILRGMGALPAEERPVIGQMANEVRAGLEEKLAEKKLMLSKAAMDEEMARQGLDVTLPGVKRAMGHRHPVAIVTEELCKIFMGMGYEIAEGPDVETDYHNFEALNIYSGHPARDEQDTFYVEGGRVLRTHTSPVQIRYMENNRPPIAIVAPGKVFRADELDATHSPVFHQLEGLLVDKGIHMGHLKGALTVFAKALFGEDVKTRFRPHHFAFTEPSAEVDFSCFSCGGKGCRICKGEGWIEMAGCGMVHPKVLARCGIDPEVYSGFAFGMGIDRIAMQRYGIPHLRLLFENDMKFLQQF
ncbi:MAG: phenylalanine--tRNA ligase subunit alpha [Clostridiales bacterium]|jgi:phenylalanyl-tRNA synthetase alpha chain|nr:phenylalanine--tRNA ligase subunit alpha [Clostridiales bacterium]